MKSGEKSASVIMRKAIQKLEKEKDLFKTHFQSSQSYFAIFQHPKETYLKVYVQIKQKI